MGTGFAKKKKQARMLQEQFSQMQEQMKAVQATGTAGNGLVSVTLNGEYELVSIKIKPECVDPQDIECLEDLIKAAYEAAFTQIQAQANNHSGLPSGLSGLGL